MVQPVTNGPSQGIGGGLGHRERLLKALIGGKGNDTRFVRCLLSEMQHDERMTNLVNCSAASAMAMNGICEPTLLPRVCCSREMLQLLAR